jgi:hypothetical protein
MTDEKQRLRKLNSLTILDYIKTQIEILMSMKLDDEKETPNAKNLGHKGRFGENNGATSEFTSTFQSIDLPPKEYEQELQHYEAEVR